MAKEPTAKVTAKKIGRFYYIKTHGTKSFSCYLQAITHTYSFTKTKNGEFRLLRIKH